MKWEKLGQVFVPNSEQSWMQSHASNPTAEPIEGSLFRVYFSCRDGDNRSSIGTVVLDVSDRPRVLELFSEPVLAPGTRGMFDDSGASMGCLVRVGSKRYLYYTGWNLSVTVPWRNSIGLAVSEHSDAPFRKWSLAPIIDRAPTDPFSLSYPWVLKEGDEWRMWYGSNLSWGPGKSDMFHVIKYASSTDGLCWKRDGQQVVGDSDPKQYAFCRPTVMRLGTKYCMWYSYRGNAYRIGYAESPDGLHWERMDDKAGIDVSDSGWDCEMIEYPCVFAHDNRLFMLYNGNDFGRTGFGLAVAS